MTRHHNPPFVRLGAPSPTPPSAIHSFTHLTSRYQPHADFQGTSASLGKPALNDITQGLATAPVLFAAHRFPALLPLIERKFQTPGDVDTALQAVAASDGIALTRKLAIAHCQVALDSIAILNDSPAKTALASLASKVLNRNR